MKTLTGHGKVTKLAILKQMPSQELLDKLLDFQETNVYEKIPIFIRNKRYEMIELSKLRRMFGVGCLCRLKIIH